MSVYLFYHSLYYLFLYHLFIELGLLLQEQKHKFIEEEQIRRQRATDHFSASLAHEIDNPICAISGIAEYETKSNNYNIMYILLFFLLLLCLLLN